MSEISEYKVVRSYMSKCFLEPHGEFLLCSYERAIMGRIAAMFEQEDMPYSATLVREFAKRMVRA